MLKRKYRLGSKIKVKFETSFPTPFFLLKTSINELQYNRFRFVISKKVSRKAVERNKIKRNISSCIENFFDDIKIGYDFLIIVKKEILNKTREEVCFEIKSALEKKGFLK